MSSRLALAMSASALVVAVLGSTPLGHAVVSNVPRNSVGPLQLKRNAVGPQKLAPNAVRTGHVLDGSLLSADFKAGQIPAGPPGPAGPAGPPGLSQKQVVTAQTASDSSSPKSVTATCPAGKQAIGGGGRIDSPGGGPVLSSSYASGVQTWHSQAYEVVGQAGAWRLTTYVVCARVT
jgi:hypothetical protein